MLYKEWRAVRLKFSVWLAVFVVIGLVHALAANGLSLNGWLRNYSYDLAQYLTPAGYLDTLKYTTTLYQDWLSKFLVAIAGCAIIAGCDIICEEKNKQTLNFLLSRSVTRSQIYNTKLFLNIIALWVAGIVGCLIVWLVDVTGPKPLDPKWVLLGTTFVLIIGAAIVCLTALISIYAKNLFQTLAFTVITLIAFYGSWSYLTEGNFLFFSISLTTFCYAGFCIAALALYFTGLSLFSHKEF